MVDGMINVDTMVLGLPSTMGEGMSTRKSMGVQIHIAGSHYVVSHRIFDRVYVYNTIYHPKQPLNPNLKEQVQFFVLRG